MEWEDEWNTGTIVELEVAEGLAVTVALIDETATPGKN